MRFSSSQVACATARTRSLIRHNITNASMPSSVVTRAKTCQFPSTATLLLYRDFPQGLVDSDVHTSDIYSTLLAFVCHSGNSVVRTYGGMGHR